MEIREGGLSFEFNPNTVAIKFDDTEFFRNEFNHLPASKGVDILADDAVHMQLIEIKDCMGHETENLWRTSVNDTKVNSAPAYLDTENRHSLDVEVAQKVASTLACLIGAKTREKRGSAAQQLSPYCDAITSRHVSEDKKQVLVILFLEGNFCSIGAKTRSKKMIMSAIQNSLKKKLSWLNCRVAVVDSQTYNCQYFKVHR